MSVDLWWLAGGTAAVLVAPVWRQVQRTRTRAQLARALCDADPIRRRAAVAVAAEQGLRRHAALLAGRVSTETDPAVRAALVTAVLRGSWEPADRRDVLRLRLWAQEATAREPERVLSAPASAGSPAGLGPQVPQARVGGHRRVRSAADPQTVAFPVRSLADPGRHRSRHAAGRPVTDPSTAPIPAVASPTRAIPAVAAANTATPPAAIPTTAIPTTAIPTTAIPTTALPPRRPRPTPRDPKPTTDRPTLRPFAVRGHG